MIGVLYLSFIFKFKKDPSFAEKYVKNSPKAYIWRKMFGEEKALKLIHTVFIPIGFVLSIGFILYGIYILL